MVWEEGESVTRCGECLLIATHLNEHIQQNEEVWSSYSWQQQISYLLERTPIAAASIHTHLCG